MSDIEEWRWADPNGQQRLVRTDELRAGLSSGMIPPNAPVWKRGWKEWQPAYSVPELTTSALSAVNGVIANIPPPPLGVLGAQKAMEQEAAGPRSARPGDVEPPAPPRYVASPTKISRPPGPTSSPPPPVHVAPDAPPPKIAEPIPETPAPAEVAGDHADTTVSPAMTDDEAERVVASAAAEPQTVATVMGIPALPLPRIPLTHPPSMPPRPAGRPMSVPPFPALAKPTISSRPPPPSPPASPPVALKTSRPPPVPARQLKTMVLFGGLRDAKVPPPKANPGHMRHATLVGGNVGPFAATPTGFDAANIEELTGSLLLEAPETGPLPSVSDTMPVEELSGSALIDASEPRLPPPARQDQDPSESVMLSESIRKVATVIPAPVVPPVAPGGTLFGFPAPRPPLPPDTEPKLGRDDDTTRDENGKLHDISALSKWRSKPFYALIAVVGTLVGLGMMGVIIKVFRATRTDAGDTSLEPAASSRAAVSGLSVVASSVASSPARAAAESCTLFGSSHTIAPRAVVPSGVEVVPLAHGIGLGFVSAPQEAMAVTFDMSSFSATSSISVHVEGTIRRLVPDEIDGKLAALAESDTPADKLAGRHVVAGLRGDPSIDIGVWGGSLAWAPHGNKTQGNKLWALEGEGPVEALRGAPILSGGEKGFALTFRRGNAVYIGAAMGTKELAPKGPLFRILGLGPQIGAPTLAALGDAVLLAWADRAGPTDPWGVRWVEWTPGTAPHGASAFVPPAGGLGDQAMSPALAAIGSGRVLLVWTEGPVSAHAIRAQTLGPGAVKIGETLTISAEGVNAGQAQAAVLPDGRGVVSYLAAKEAAAGAGKVYEVVATPIACPTPK